jgi:hypothetical protein
MQALHRIAGCARRNLPLCFGAMTSFGAAT